MKKIWTLFVVSFLLFSTSCEKKYTCHCTQMFTYSDRPVEFNRDTMTYRHKKDMDKYCEQVTIVSKTPLTDTVVCYAYAYE